MPLMDNDAFTGLDGLAPYLDRIGTDSYRRYLRARIDNLRNTPDAFALFVAAMETIQMPGLAKCQTHTNRELRTIENEVIKAEAAHGVRDFATAIVPLTMEQVDEGKDLTAEQVDELRQLYVGTSANDRIAVDVWGTEAQAAGLSVHMSERQTERRAAILRARLALASPDFDPDVVRALIAHVTTEDWPLMANISVGAGFGALTIAQANRLVELVPHVGDLPLTFDKAGVMFVGQVAA